MFTESKCQVIVTFSVFFQLTMISIRISSPPLFFYVGHEGRIGMAAVTLKKEVQFDGRKIYNHVVSCLPSYARPRFIRMQVI